MMKDFEEFRVSDEELAGIAGGQQLVKIMWNEPNHKGSITIEAKRLDEYKQRLTARGKDFSNYKFSKPFEKGDTPVFE